MICVFFCLICASLTMCSSDIFIPLLTLLISHMRPQWPYFFKFPCPFLHLNSDLCVLVGFKVAVISRDDSRLERLRALVSPTTKDKLTTLVGNVGKWAATRSRDDF